MFKDFLNAYLDECDESQELDDSARRIAKKRTNNMYGPSAYEVNQVKRNITNTDFMVSLLPPKVWIVIAAVIIIGMVIL